MVHTARTTPALPTRITGVEQAFHGGLLSNNEPTHNTFLCEEFFALIRELKVVSTDAPGQI